MNYLILFISLCLIIFFLIGCSNRTDIELYPMEIKLIEHYNDDNFHHIQITFDDDTGYHFQDKQKDVVDQQLKDYLENNLK